MRVKVKIKENKHYVRLINGIFNLTNKEIDVVAAFLDLEAKGYLFSKENKERVVEKLKIGSYNTINVYMKRFVDKKVLFKNGKKYQFNPLLKPINSDTEITFVCQKI